MIIMIPRILTEIEQIFVLLNKENGKAILNIKALSRNKSFSSKLLVDKLNKKRGKKLGIKDIVIYMTYLLLENYNAKIYHQYKDQVLEICLILEL